MNSPIEVCETTEWATLAPDSCPLLKGRMLDSDATTHNLTDKLADSGMLQVTELRSGLMIQTYSHVGRVKIGNLIITIHPKIENKSLMSLLRYAFGFRGLHLTTEYEQKVAKSGFQDLLITQLNAEVRELIAGGLRRTYLISEEELASPRGRIDIQKIANKSGMTSPRLPCSHYPRTEDTLLNRVLRAGLNFAAFVSGDQALRRESNRLSDLFAGRVSSIRLNTSIIESIQRGMNRLTVAYEPAVEIIKILYEFQGILFQAASHSLRLPGFLFDMNRFFQALVSRFLRENLPDHTVKDERRLAGMMQYAHGLNPQRRIAPNPRPDFAIMTGDKVTALLDAKYRDLWTNKLPREMLYQLAVYATSHSEKTSSIIYPTSNTAAQESRIDIRQPVSGHDIARVWLRPLILPKLLPLITAPRSAQVSRKSMEYARWLAFGSEGLASAVA
jgi:5-methylcytosine-specific restriction enzyme subunit McrC